MKKEYVNPVIEIIKFQSEDTLAFGLSSQDYDNDVNLFGEDD